MVGKVEKKTRDTMDITKFLLLLDERCAFCIVQWISFNVFKIEKFTFENFCSFSIDSLGIFRKRRLK
jgi:hypothetical protein